MKKRIRFNVYFFLCISMAVLSGCGGGGGGSRGYTPNPVESYLSASLYSPTSSEKLTDEQLAANTALIQKAIKANSDVVWTVDSNPKINGKLLTEMTADELAMLAGSIPTSELAELLAGRSAGKLASKLAAADLPTSVDWRNYNGKNWLTSVRDQGQCGSCVAHAALGTLEAMVKISSNNPDMTVDLSESDLFRCTGTGGDTQGSCSQGWHGYYAATQLKNVGVVDETCLPYQAQDNVCGNKCSGGTVTKIKDFAYASTQGWGPQSTDTWIKNALLSGPVQAGITVYQDFMQYKSGVYQHVTGSSEGGHAIVIVGYNDNGGYWIVRNSWGSDWGENGYVNIKYGQVGINEFVISYQMDTAPVSVQATVSPASGSTSDTYTLTCTATGGALTSTNTLEARCNSSDSWAAISGTTKTCTYSAAGSYTPACRVNGSVTDDVDAAVTVSASATCGNGTTETGETCDDGNTTTETCTYGQTSCSVCNSTCQTVAGATSYCGDSNTDTTNGESCDDGNTTAGDGCSASCQTETTSPVCGNSTTETGETCDDGNTTTETCAYGQTSCSVCNSTCQTVAGATSYCGDSSTDSTNGETCDDGNTTTETCAYGQTSCSVCDATCQTVAGATSYCGDSTTDSTNGETCDDGNTTTETCTYGQTSCSICDATCQTTAGATSYCGDGTVDSSNSEQCDDSNTTAGDGCSDTCQLEMPACTTYTAENFCEQDPDCWWHAGTGDCYSIDCENYLNQTDCSTDSYCTWNSGSGICEDNGYCATLYFDEASCESYAYCEWDSYNSVCYDIISCIGYGDQTSCESDVYCSWDSGSSTCYENTCAYNLDTSSCALNTFCTWDSSSMICYDNADCVSNVEIEGCSLSAGAGPGCTWVSGICDVDTSGRCDGYSDQTSCDSDSYCFWNSGLCFEDPTICDGYSDQTTCQSDSDCWWDSLSGGVCIDN